MSLPTLMHQRLTSQLEEVSAYAAKFTEARNILVIGFFEHDGQIHAVTGGTSPVPPQELFATLARSAESKIIQ